jgi:hypothetical protein
LKRQILANSRWAPNAVAFVALIFPLLALSACPGSLGSDFVLTGAGGGNGAGGSPGGADAGPVLTSCANSMTVLMSNCTVCHNNPPSELFANLDLLSDNVGQRLVGVPGSSAGMCSAAGNGNLLNRTVLPATGILIDKINGRQSCGMSMPYGSPMMAPADIACLQAWANGLVSATP